MLPFFRVSRLCRVSLPPGRVSTRCITTKHRVLFERSPRQVDTTLKPSRIQSNQGFHLNSDNSLLIRRTFTNPTRLDAESDQQKAVDDSADDLTQILTEMNRDIESRQPELVLKKFFRLQKQFGTAPIQAYAYLIEACFRMNDTVGANLYFQELKTKGLKPTLAIYNSLIRVNLSSDSPKGLPSNAFQLFRSLVADGLHPNETTFAGLVEAARQLGDFGRAKEQLRVMERDYNLEPGPLIFSSLLTAAVDLHKAGEALKIVTLMNNSGHQVETEQLLSILYAALESIEVGVAEKILRRCVKDSLPVDEGTLLEALALASFVGSSSLADTVWEVAQTIQLEPSSMLFDGLVLAFSRAKDLGKALYLFQERTNAGYVSSKKLSDVLVRECSSSVEVLDQAYLAMESLHQSGVHILPETLHVILTACVVKGDTERAFATMHSLNEVFGYPSDTAAFHALLHGALWAKDIVQAEEIFDLMVAARVEQNSETWGYMIATASSCSQPRKGLYYLKQAMEAIGEVEYRHYFPLVECCMRLNMVHEVEGLLKEMREKGIHAPKLEGLLRSRRAFVPQKERSTTAFQKVFKVEDLV